MSKDATPGPAAAREAVRAYVAAVHHSYLGHVAHLAPGDRAGLPLVQVQTLTVVAAAARRLHLVATPGPMPPPRGPEVEVHDSDGGLDWTVRFADPSVLPALGILVEDSPAEVRRVLGLLDVVYHLTVDVGGGLDGHAATHGGVALANQHTRVLRDLDRLRHALPQQGPLVEELAACARLGLDHAAALLVHELTAGRVEALPRSPAERSVQRAVEDLARAGSR